MKVKFYILFAIASFLSTRAFGMESNNLGEICQKELEAAEKINETLLKIEAAKNKPGLTPKEQIALHNYQQLLTKKSDELNEKMFTHIEELLDSGEKLDIDLDIDLKQKSRQFIWEKSNEEKKKEEETGFCIIN